MKTAGEYITEKYQDNNWVFYPPSRRLVTEWLEDFANTKAKARLEEAAEKLLNQKTQHDHDYNRTIDEAVKILLSLK